jgi:hypothetical protein
MTLSDWIEESRNRFGRETVPVALYESVYELARGGLRRVYQYGSDPIWVKGEWDVLVVLDATRVDLMREVAPQYGLGPVETTWSNASCSIDWIRDTFNRYPGHTTSAGYITGNPFADTDSPDEPSADLRDGNLAYFAPLYETCWQEINGGPVETIPPEPLTDQTIAVWRDRNIHDIDRLVVHYMQPHQPFRSRPDWEGVSQNMKNLAESRTRVDLNENIWHRLKRGELEHGEVWNAYHDNLRWALDDITDRLLSNLDARVAITSDHGNALGEWGEWAHPPGALSPPVWRVPWVEVEAKDEHTVDPEPTTVDEDVDSDTEDQLSALGYL